MKRKYLTRPIFKRQGNALLPVNDDARALLATIADGDARSLSIRVWSGSGKVIGFGPHTCKHCGVSFNPYPGARASYCSPRCSYTARTRPAIDLFWEKVSPEPNSGCWLWTGSAHTFGYGNFGGTHRAHRFAYEFYVGPIPPGLVLRHTCDNPYCVNPDHLIPGTQAENIEDAFVRGRRARGRRRAAA